ncbi:MAG: RidA family protein [Chloroflexota bacterium]
MNPQRGKGTVEYVVSARSRDSTLEHVMSEHRLTVSSGSPFEATIGFSRAVRAGDRVLVSGTAPVWPDGSCDPDPEVQARRCFEIIVQALRETGARPDQVVRTRMYVTDVAYAEAVGRAHGAVFAGIRPAATMVVIAALLDARWKVEIEAEAIIDEAHPAGL